MNFKNMTRKDYGKNALTGILAGGILNMAHLTESPLINISLSIFGSVLSVLGFLCGLIWIYRIIRKIQ